MLIGIKLPKYNGGHMSEQIYIGSKDISRYISAVFYTPEKEKNIIIMARGSNIKKAIDILAILIRDYLDNPKYVIKVDSEPFDKRKVSTLEITLTGTEKENIKKIEKD